MSYVGRVLVYRTKWQNWSGHGVLRAQHLLILREAPASRYGQEWVTLRLEDALVGQVPVDYILKAYGDEYAWMDGAG